MPFGLQQGIHVDSLQWSNVLSGTLFFLVAYNASSVPSSIKKNP